MQKRFVTIWFPYLKTDWFTRREPELKHQPFVLYASSHGRMIITAVNKMAESKGIYTGTVLADARAIVPSIVVKEDTPDFFIKKLKDIAVWFIRFAPIVAIDPPDGIIIDATGCIHLWGTEEAYLLDIRKRLLDIGYTIRSAMADTIGAAWAVTRFGEQHSIIPHGAELAAIGYLPPESLRIDAGAYERLHKLGLHCIRDFIHMPGAVLRRRFGNEFIQQLQYALGYKEEYLTPVEPLAIYHERLQCLEPIVTATGIQIALQNVLSNLCRRLQMEQKGLRTAIFKAYRVDNKIEQIDISVNRPSSDQHHLFHLFELKICTITPSAGIELFTLDALKIEDNNPEQEKCWNETGTLTGQGIAQLMDRFCNRIGEKNIHRFLPAEHYIPERSVKKADSLSQDIDSAWCTNNPRPVQIMTTPEPVMVTAPIPDYPPMLFRYKDKVHKIIKADGPERIEQEWWLQDGRHRDYYYVEDEEGCRYWLFRSGHYDDGGSGRWFLHGYCA